MAAVIVKTLMGDLEGCKSEDFDGNEVFQFLGIPYAKPPIGELRFKDPYPLDSWTGVLDAKKDGNACYHKELLTKQSTGSEDCLYLNVFTRTLPDESDNLKPVMIFIHGGAFVFGSNSHKTFSPDYLLTQDVVLVTINYRIGLLGFLRIKDSDQHVYGNMGFKDQVAALRWVKNNITQFNGDPNNVTIFGESSGAASVHYHILSPLSKGLFHKAILQSGSALNPWSDECDHSAIQIARTKNPKIQTEAEALTFLRGLSVEELHDLQVEFMEKIAPGSMRPFGLVIENSPKNVAFISKRPIDIIISGDYNKVPIIFGYNDREGIIFNHMIKLTGDPREKNIESYLPYNVNFRGNSDLKRKYIEKLENVYFKGNDEDDSFISIMSDAWFVAGIIGSARNHTLTSGYPVYLYKITLDTKLNYMKTLLWITDIPGCSHSDELSYLFNTTDIPVKIEQDSLEELGMRRLVKLWTNFAKYSNPTPDEHELKITWKPVKARQINVLNIGNEELKMEINPDGKRIDLWKEIFSQSISTNKYL